MNAEYDQIAEQYRDSKQLPFRDLAEAYTFFQMAGDLRGQTILDLACGEGFLTRKLRRRGADRVVGVDLSEAMVRLGQEREAVEQLGNLEFQQHDAADMPHLGTFDTVTALYLLNYADSRKLLRQFVQTAYDNLRPGGRFLGFNDNVAQDPTTYGNHRKYGFIKECPTSRTEGDAIRYTFFNPDGTAFQFNNFYLHPETYAAVFAEVGFEDFRWVPAEIEPVHAMDPYWADFLRDQPLVGFTAWRPE